jgi:hypothetical protein
VRVPQGRLVGLITATGAVVSLLGAASTASADSVTDPGDTGAAGQLRTELLNSVAGETIQIAPGVNPTLVGSDILVPNHALTIAGQGPGTTITGPAADRIFVVTSAVTIRDLTLTGGNAPAGASPGAGPGGPGEDGGAIRSLGNLTVERVVFSGNEAGTGGNGATGESGGAGGWGGAIFNDVAGNLVVNQSSFINNSAGHGGIPEGISTGGAGGAGGAIASGGPSLLVSNSTFSGNTGGNGISGFLGGSGGDGGAIFSQVEFKVINATFSANLAGAGGDGVGPDTTGGDGGAIYSPNGPGTVVSTTAADNGVGAGGDGTGGAIAGGTGSIGLRNTILANNTGPTSEFNCQSGTAADNGSNIAFPLDSGCPGTFSAGDPLLGPLAGNGGPTQTRALGVGSSAIDAVPLSGCADLGVGRLGTDQRGYPRPLPVTFNGNCDVGAYEAHRCDGSSTILNGPYVACPPRVSAPPKTKCKKPKKKGKGKAAAKKKKKCRKKRKKK